MSRRENSPVELPMQGFVTFYDTTVDSDFIELTNGMRIGTGRLIPKKFVPPDDETTPQHLFPAGTSYRARPPVERFIHRLTPSIFLVYTDGSCLGNGSRNPKAGCGIVFKPAEDSKGNKVQNYFRFPLENKGPQNDECPQTSNRAELRAVIAACQFRAWSGEGFATMVIATDSEYVVEGITTWINGWIRRGWQTSKGQLVKNRDLWECLLGEIEMAAEEGLDVQFWRIPREWNTEADHHATLAAAEMGRANNFTKCCGMLV